MNSSMDNLDKLSDSELQRRLIQFGFPNMPVTSTTRKILVKKLRNQLKDEKAKLRKETKYATRYSSDDESDIDTTNKNKATSNMATIRTTSIHSRNMPPPQSSVILSRRTIANSLNRNPTVYVSNNCSTNSPHAQTNSSQRTSRIYVPPPIYATDNNKDDSDYMVCSNSILNNSKNSNNSIWSTTSSNNYCLTPDQSINNSWASAADPSSSSNVRINKSYHDDYSHNVNGNNNNSNDSSYTSDFTRRLLNLRGETIKDSNFCQKKNLKYPITSSSLPLNNLRKSVNASVGGSSTIRQTLSDYRTTNEPHNLSPASAFSDLLNKLNEQYGVKQTIVPYVLVGIFIVFFSLLIVMYLTMTPDLANALNEKNTIYNYCNDDGVHRTDSALITTSSYDCIESDSLENALRFVKIIVPILQKRAEEHRCSDNSKPYQMSAKEAVRLVQKIETTNIDVRKTIKDLHNVEYLIENNPQWNINHVDDTGKLIDFDQVQTLRNNQGNYFAILNPRLPFLCTIYNKMQQFFFVVGTIGLVVLIAGIIYLCYKFIINYNKSKRDTINYFIDEIIKNLMKKAATDPDQCSIFINHLRDRIIPLHKRKKLDKDWQEAISYLENHESRILFEMGVVCGEDCKMLKWIDTVSSADFDSNNQRSSVKKWQSPAFDKTNKIINPPTSCLKIRQMFDKFEANDRNLKTIIQDAILEKVGPKCKIYDIQLDKQSCCVYVRCASEKDAGIVHNEINGWWFDKRLVSIKFLRIERYLSRFSKSSAGPACLQPSNAKNLSMSQCCNSETDNSLEEDDDDDDIEN